MAAPPSPVEQQRKRKKEDSDDKTETAASEVKKIESMEYYEIRDQKDLDAHLDVPTPTLVKKSRVKLNMAERALRKWREDDMRHNLAQVSVHPEKIFFVLLLVMHTLHDRNSRILLSFL
jgi:hypothetical protein